MTRMRQPHTTFMKSRCTTWRLFAQNAEYRLQGYASGAEHAKLAIPGQSKTADRCRRAKPKGIALKPE